MTNPEIRPERSYFDSESKLGKRRWMFVKELVFERDEHCCRRCKTKRALTVHHIESRKRGGTTDLRNLITLCVSCHDWAESQENLTWEKMMSVPPKKQDPKTVYARTKDGYVVEVPIEIKKHVKNMTALEVLGA